MINTCTEDVNKFFIYKETNEIVCVLSKHKLKEETSESLCYYNIYFVNDNECIFFMTTEQMFNYYFEEI